MTTVFVRKLQEGKHTKWYVIKLQPLYKEVTVALFGPYVNRYEADQAAAQLENADLTQVR